LCKIWAYFILYGRHKNITAKGLPINLPSLGKVRKMCRCVLFSTNN
jgi:hypothetical protein